MSPDLWLHTEFPQYIISVFLPSFWMELAVGWVWPPTSEAGFDPGAALIYDNGINSDKVMQLSAS